MLIIRNASKTKLLKGGNMRNIIIMQFLLEDCVFCVKNNHLLWVYWTYYMLNNRPVLALKCLLAAGKICNSTLSTLPLHLFLLSVDSCFTSSQSLELPYAVECHFVFGCLDYGTSTSLWATKVTSKCYGVPFTDREGFISVLLLMLNPDVTGHL